MIFSLFVLPILPAVLFFGYMVHLVVGSLRTCVSPCSRRLPAIRNGVTLGFWWLRWPTTYMHTYGMIFLSVPKEDRNISDMLPKQRGTVVHKSSNMAAWGVACRRAVVTFPGFATAWRRDSSGCGDRQLACILMEWILDSVFLCTFGTCSVFGSGWCSCFWFPQHMLRVSFSPGRNRACRHCWIYFWGTPSGKRLLLFKQFVHAWKKIIH